MIDPDLEMAALLALGFSPAAPILGGTDEETMSFKRILHENDVFGSISRRYWTK